MVRSWEAGRSASRWRLGVLDRDLPQPARVGHDDDFVELDRDRDQLGEAYIDSGAYSYSAASVDLAREKFSARVGAADAQRLVEDLLKIAGISALGGRSAGENLAAAGEVVDIYFV